MYHQVLTYGRMPLISAWNVSLQFVFISERRQTPGMMTMWSTRSAWALNQPCFLQCTFVKLCEASVKSSSSQYSIWYIANASFHTCQLLLPESNFSSRDYPPPPIFFANVQCESRLGRCLGSGLVTDPALAAWPGGKYLNWLQLLAAHTRHKIQRHLQTSLHGDILPGYE